MAKFLGTYTGMGLSKNGRPEVRIELTSEGAVKSVSEIAQGNYLVDMKKPRNERSLSQNALMWELIGQIDIKENGRRTKHDDEQIYINVLKMAGVKFYSVELDKGAVDRFKELTADTFRAYEIVREYVDWVNGGDTVLIHCFIGSSRMDTKEMSKVIDATLEYAKQVGIDTAYWELQMRGLSE